MWFFVDTLFLEFVFQIIYHGFSRLYVATITPKIVYTMGWSELGRKLGLIYEGMSGVAALALREICPGSLLTNHTCKLQLRIDLFPIKFVEDVFDHLPFVKNVSFYWLEDQFGTVASSCTKK